MERERDRGARPRGAQPDREPDHQEGEGDDGEVVVDGGRRRRPTSARTEHSSASPSRSTRIARVEPGARLRSAASPSRDLWIGLPSISRRRSPGRRPPRHPGSRGVTYSTITPDGSDPTPPRSPARGARPGSRTSRPPGEQQEGDGDGDGPAEPHPRNRARRRRSAGRPGRRGRLRLGAASAAR